MGIGILHKNNNNNSYCKMKSNIILAITTARMATP
jgi:hypothetical protein